MSFRVRSATATARPSISSRPSKPLEVPSIVGGPPAPDGWTVEARVETATDQPVIEPLTAALTPFRSDAFVDRLMGADGWPGPVAHLEATVADIRPWSTEVPQRYRLVVPGRRE